MFADDLITVEGGGIQVVERLSLYERWTGLAINYSQDLSLF